MYFGICIGVFAKIVSGLDVWMGSEYASVEFIFSWKYFLQTEVV